MYHMCTGMFRWNELNWFWLGVSSTRENHPRVQHVCALVCLSQPASHPAWTIATARVACSCQLEAKIAKNRSHSFFFAVVVVFDIFNIRGRQTSFHATGHHWRQIGKMEKNLMLSSELKTQQSSDCAERLNLNVWCLTALYLFIGLIISFKNFEPLKKCSGWKLKINNFVWCGTFSGFRGTWVKGFKVVLKYWWSVSMLFKSFHVGSFVLLKYFFFFSLFTRPQSWPPSPSVNSSKAGDVLWADSSTWWLGIPSSPRTRWSRPSSPSAALWVASSETGHPLTRTYRCTRGVAAAMTDRETLPAYKWPCVTLKK